MGWKVWQKKNDGGVSLAWGTAHSLPMSPSSSMPPPPRDYLNDEALWSKCLKPEDVVPWNLTLFSILLVVGAIQMLLCVIQVVNGLLGTLCGDCQCCGCCGVS